MYRLKSNFVRMVKNPNKNDIFVENENQDFKNLAVGCGKCHHSVLIYHCPYRNGGMELVTRVTYLKLK